MYGNTQKKYAKEKVNIGNYLVCNRTKNMGGKTTLSNSQIHALTE